MQGLGCTNYPTNINCTAVLEIDEGFNPLMSYLGDFLEVSYVYSGPSAAQICQTLCTNTTELTNWKHFCPHMRFVDKRYYNGLFFFCETNNTDDSAESYHLIDICDGKVQCTNNADEVDCPDRFYCSKDEETLSWIDEGRVCDQRKDCKTGIDECSGCVMEGLASSEFLVNSKIVAAFAIIVGLGIIVINISVGLKTFHTESSSKAAEIDRILRLQICFYDCLMGFYMISLIVAAVKLRLKGNYCEFDEEWRSSLSCELLGITFSVSSHGSLLVIAIMSILRCLKCTMGNTIDLSIKTVIIMSFIVSLLNLFHAVLPTLPVHEIQSFFRTSIYLTAVERNPFITAREGSAMIEQVENIHRHYFHNSSPSIDVLRMVADLKHANITSDDGIFEVSDICYYGNTPLCISNIFKMQQSYQVYKISYCIVISTLLAVMSAAYITILHKAKRCQQEVGQAAHENTSRLAVKVSLMIISQILSWVSFIVAVIVFTWVLRYPPPAKLFEIFALIVIPANSLLNPIFYSELYKTIGVTFMKFVHSFKMRNRVEDIELHMFHGQEGQYQS